MYIKINGSDIHYNATITPFKTQKGNQGIRVNGDMPETDKGFKIYEDNGELVNDLSDYIYLYDTNKYTNVEEKIQGASMSYQPLAPSAYDKLSSRISQVSNRVNETANSLAETNDALCEYTTDNDIRVGELEDSFCEYSTDMDSRVGEVEDSLCELSEDTENE